MACLLSNGRLNRFVITIFFSLALGLGTNITIANASNQSSADKASISLEQTTPNNEKVVQLQKPGTVTGLTATSKSYSQVNLKWTAVSGASSYKIYRSATSSGTYTPIGTSTTSSYSDNGLKADTNYYYKVSGVNAKGEGAQSSKVHIKTVSAKPKTVTGLKATLESYSQVNLKWTAVSGASSYKIYRSATSSGTYTPIGTSTTSSYSDNGLKANTTYYYKVSGVNAEGEGARSSNVKIKTVAAKPKTVTGLIVTVASTSQLDLTWTAVSEASSYKIYRSEKSSGNYTRIGTSTTTSFSNKGLKANATYYYKVSAVNEIGEGKKSNEVLGTTKVPGTVTNLSVEVISGSQLDLSWKVVKGVTSYLIYRSSSSSGDYIRIGTSTTASFSNKGLKSNATYYYKVSAVNGVGEGAKTNAVLGETKVPEQVTNLHVEVLSETQLELSWKAVSKGVSYRIYRSSSSSGNYTFISTSATTSYRNKGLKDNTMYYYRVSAVNGVGEGTMSSAVSGQTE